MGIYMQGEMAFSMPNLRGWFYRLCTGVASTVLKICLGWWGTNSLLVSGLYFLGDLLTILSAFEDSRSFMGGSDVVHCVRVPLTGTTMAAFSRMGMWLGLFSEHFTDSVYNSMDYWGPLYHCTVMGPHPGNVARSICLIL